MKISNLIEMTPELKRDILWTLRTAKMLENHLKGTLYSIMIDSTGEATMTIYDRHEGDFGFYTHDFKEDGSYKLDFVNNAHTPEADLYEKAFLKEFNPARYEQKYEEDSDVSEDR